MKGMDYLRQALEADPGHALAWACLSRARSCEAGLGWTPVTEGYSRAREAAQRALALEPDLAEGHLALGMVQMSHDWDWKSADASYGRALELAPGSAEALRAAGGLARDLGRLEEAIALGRRAVEQDPLSPGGYNGLGTTYRVAGLLSDAETAYRRALEISPQRVANHMMLSLVLLAQGRGEEALTEAMQEPEEWAHLFALAVVHHAGGRREESDRALRDLTEKHAGEAALQIAATHAIRGEAEAAFEWLERAYSQRDAGLGDVRSEPAFASLHTDRRWGAFVKKMGLAD
jgi:tetratricopeptide (TPR) repeat protein